MKKTEKNENPFGLPSVVDIYHCMVSCPKWVRLLLGNGKDYQAFLSQLISVNFFKEVAGKTTIKEMSDKFGIRRAPISNWIKEMYQDIIDLNYDKPELFQNEGVLYELHFKGYRGSVFFKLWLQTTPRLYEKVEFFFLEAKLGSRLYWVKDLHHEFDDNGHTIYVNLEGGILNTYREGLIDRALFDGVLGFMDIYKDNEYEIDKQLKLFYK